MLTLCSSRMASISLVVNPLDFIFDSSGARLMMTSLVLSVRSTAKAGLTGLYFAKVAFMIFNYFTVIFIGVTFL